MAVVVVIVVITIVVVDVATVTNGAEFLFTIIMTTITLMIIINTVDKLVKRIFFHFRRQYSQLNTRKRKKNCSLFTTYLILYRVFDRISVVCGELG